ncbi:MAG TPA: F0F1 ATP synthase subunit B [Chloroflexota bacterium]|nr:F0F1 ATP synthase subunit B [Chloroflexota bacterium]
MSSPVHIDFTLIVQVASFLIFFALLRSILYRPLAAVFQERAKRIEQGLRAAEEAQRRAEETQREVKRRLDQARQEAQAQIAAAVREVGAQRQEMMARAKAEADAVLAEAQAEIQRERQAAVEALRREVVPLAILAASRVAGRSLDTPAARDLADRAVAEAGRTV